MARGTREYKGPSFDSSEEGRRGWRDQRIGYFDRDRGGWILFRGTSPREERRGPGRAGCLRGGRQAEYHLMSFSSHKAYLDATDGILRPMPRVKVQHGREGVGTKEGQAVSLSGVRSVVRTGRGGNPPPPSPRGGQPRLLSTRSRCKSSFLSRPQPVPRRSASSPGCSQKKGTFKRNQSVAGGLLPVFYLIRRTSFDTNTRDVLFEIFCGLLEENLPHVGHRTHVLNRLLLSQNKQEPTFLKSFSSHSGKNFLKVGGSCP